MKVLVVYASNSGNARAAALSIGEILKKKRFEVAVQDVVHTAPDDISVSDVCIIGSCTWLRSGLQGQLPEHMYDFCEELKAKHRFRGKPFAVFGFGRSEYTYFCGAADELEKVVQEVGGRLIGPTLRVNGFYHHNEAAVAEWAETLTQTAAA